MLDSASGISRPGLFARRAPQAETHGELTTVAIPELPVLRPEDTARMRAI